MATYYVDSNAGVVEYSNKAWSVGELMVPAEADVTTNHLVAKGWIWEVTTGGTSSATPTWPASVTDDVTTVTEAGGVVWTARLPDNWTHALPGLYWLGVSTSVVPAATDTTYVAHNHTSKIYTNTNTAVLNGIVQCVTSGTTTPASGAVERSNTARNLQYNGTMLYMYGITFQAGTGSSSTSYIYFGVSSTCRIRFENCVFYLNHTNALGYTRFGVADTTAQNQYDIHNCTFRFSAAGQYIDFNGSSPKTFINCLLDGTAVTSLIKVSTGRGAAGYHEFIGCSFGTPTNLMDISIGDEPARFKFINCKVPSSITTGTHFGIGSTVIECHSCSSSDSIIDYYYQDGTGVVQESSSIYLTTGGSQIKQADGTLTPYSLELNPSADASKVFPLYTPWVSKFIGSTGSKTFSLKIAYDDATALKDCEAWLEVEYYKNTTDPLSQVEVSAPVVSGTISRDILATGSNLTDTSEAWTGTGAWTNKKTATLSKTVTVNQQGYVRCRVAVAKDVTVYADQTVGMT